MNYISEAKGGRIGLKPQPLGIICCPLDEGGRNPQLAITRLQMCRFGWTA